MALFQPRGYKQHSSMPPRTCTVCVFGYHWSCCINFVVTLLLTYVLFFTHILISNTPPCNYSCYLTHVTHLISTCDYIISYMYMHAHIICVECNDNIITTSTQNMFDGSQNILYFCCSRIKNLTPPTCWLSSNTFVFWTQPSSNLVATPSEYHMTSS